MYIGSLVAGLISTAEAWPEDGRNDAYACLKNLELIFTQIMA